MSTPHERRNRAFWDGDADAYQAAHGEELAAAPLAWGAFRVAEAELGILGDVRGLDVLELGCGAAQWSGALTGIGAHPVGLDQSVAQLGHARRYCSEHGASVPLVLASAEDLPFGDRTFDVVFCDHGALSFCDPDVAVPEVARVLRPGGLLAFCHTTPLLYLTYDWQLERQSRRLHLRHRDLGMIDTGDGTVDFVLPHGDWIRLFRRHGFEIEDLVELVAPKGATTSYVDFAPYRWARSWPAEQIWKVRKR